MKKKQFNAFFNEFEELIDSYIGDAWDVKEKWFDEGSGEIIIEIDYDEIDWGEVSEDWESDCDGDLNDLCQEWGAGWDWCGCEIKIGFNL